MLFERCIVCCCLCVKSEFFCPRCLNEKLFEANNSQTKDAVTAREQKAVVTVFACAGTFCLLFSHEK